MPLLRCHNAVFTLETIFFFQFFKGYIPSDPDTAMQFNVTCGQDGADIPVQTRLGQAVLRNAVAEHAAGLFVLFKDHRGIALFRQIEGTAQTRRACTDDGNLFGEVAVEGRNNLLGNIAGLGIQILLSNELLDLIDGDGLVDTASGTSVLTAAVTDPAADSGQRIVLLDESQCLGITALCCHLQIALNGNMGRTCGLAGSGTGIIAVNTVVITVVLIPHVGTPFHLAGQRMLGIFNLLAVLGAKLLTQLDSTGRTNFHALAAGNAVISFDSCHIGAAGQVGGIEQLGSPKGVADIDVAVKGLQEELADSVKEITASYTSAIAVAKDEITKAYTEEIKNALQSIANKYDASKILLNITGGEPLVRKDLFEVMKFANEIGYILANEIDIKTAKGIGLDSNKLYFQRIIKQILCMFLLHCESHQYR